MWEKVAMGKKATCAVQQWGNSLAARIPAAVARSAHFVVGQPVEVSAADDGVLVKRIGSPKLTLAQKLAAFEPAPWRRVRSAPRPCDAGTITVGAGPAAT